MTFPSIEYRTDFRPDVPTVTIEGRDIYETFTERELEEAIKTVRSQRAKYKESAEWHYVLNAYEGALKLLKMQTNLERR